MWKPLMLLVIILAFWFLSPLWLIWVVKELFGVDWHSKYWAVWSLMLLVGFVTNASRSKT